MAMNCCINIAGIPEGLERRTIYQTFSSFGKVEKLYIHPNKPSCGCIYLETSSAAEDAINVLNGAPPLYLKLERKRSVQNSSLIDDLISNSSSSMSNYNDDVMADVGPVLVNVLGVQVPTLSTDDGEVYVPLSAVKGVGFELFEPQNVPLHLDFNEQVKREFELYLSMKTRKFLIRHNIEIASRDVESVKQRLTRQVFPNLHHTPNVDSNTIQIATPNRSNPQHTSNSDYKPYKKHFNNRKNTNQAATNSLRKPHSRNDQPRGSTVSSGGEGQVSPSKPYSHQDDRGSSNNYDEPIMRNGYSSENFSKLNTKLHDKVDDQNKENKGMQISINHNRATSVETPKLSHSPTPVKISLEQTPPPSYKQIDLQLNVPTLVVVSHVESIKKCWIYRKDDQELVERTLFDTNAAAIRSCAIQATIGKICAALFNTAWYRAIILNTSPALKVHYLDFGNKNTEILKEVRKLPDEIINRPTLSVCLMFENRPNTNLEEGLEIIITPIQKHEDGTYLVRVETNDDVTKNLTVETEIPLKSPQPAITKIPIQRAINPGIEIKAGSLSLQGKPNKVSTPIQDLDKPALTPHHSKSTKPQPLQTTNEKQPEIETKKTRKSAADYVGSNGYFECADFAKDNVIIAAVLPDSFLEQIAILENISEESVPNVDCIAKIGDTVAVLKEDQAWARGTIINVKNNEYVAALIDYGTVISTNSICHLDKKYVDIPEFTCVCSLDTDSMKLIKMYSTDIMFTIIEANKLKLEFSNGASVVVDCKRWDPFLTSSLACVENPTPMITTPPSINVLKSHDIVLIVSIGSEGKLYVRTKECNTLFREITQEISQYDAQPLKVMPVKNQIVLCSYNGSGQLYRGIVNSINNSYAEIDFIDFGYQETIPLKNLHIINESLASKMSTLIPITLKNFVMKEFTDNALELLSKYCKEKTKFTAVSTLDDEIFELQDISKSCLSVKLLSLDEPKCCFESSAPSHDSYQKMSEYELEIGMNDLVCIYAEALDEGKVGFISDSDITNKFVELAEKINEHIKNDNEPYVPMKNEICLAQFEDEWYRAKVHQVNKSKDEFDVYYIDYGNSSTVASSNIRNIPNDFTTMPPLVVQCILEDISVQRMSKNGLERLQTLIVAGKSYIVDIKRKENSFYQVIIPSVTTVLRAEGFL